MLIKSRICGTRTDQFDSKGNIHRLSGSSLLRISCGMSDGSGNALTSYDALSQTYMIYMSLNHQLLISCYSSPGPTGFDKSSRSYSQR